MLTEERQARIVKIIDALGSVTVQHLMEELDASESTIRRDLNALDGNGLLVKVHGGAVAKNGVFSTRDDDVILRKERNRKEKIKIAKYAASLITSKDFVYLDAGTTTELMIEYLCEPGAVFVTNSFSHAKKLAQLGYTTYILGGELKSSTEAVVGDEAIESLRKYNFTKGFFGTNGVSMKRGFSTPEVKEAMVKRTAIANTKEVYVLCDESKFSQISCVSFADFKDATIITTKAPSENYRQYSNIVEVMK